MPTQTPDKATGGIDFELGHSRGCTAYRVERFWVAKETGAGRKAGAVATSKAEQQQGRGATPGSRAILQTDAVTV
jgi:hypothetical protein